MQAGRQTDGQRGRQTERQTGRCRENKHTDIVKKNVSAIGKIQTSFLRGQCRSFYY
jgi:hypothetical protein